MNQDLIDKIMLRPDAPVLASLLNERMAEERARRAAFYEWIDEYTKAEFINGEIVVHSPVKRRHWKITDLLSSLLSVYTRVKGLGVVGTEKIMIALTRNDYEPDIVFFSTAKAAAFEDDQVLFPAPDFVVEVLSKKMQRVDRVIKKADYAAHGIREYWIVDPGRQTIEQYLLIQPTDTVYFEPYLHHPGDDIESRVIEGFRIPVAALFDERKNIAALQALLS